MWICGTIYIQNLAWCGNTYPRNSRIEFKLMGKMLCTAADMSMGMHDANAIEQLGRIAYSCGFSKEYW